MGRKSLEAAHRPRRKAGRASAAPWPCGRPARVMLAALQRREPGGRPSRSTASDRPPRQLRRSHR
eukprot:124814-Prymnesium_polylepis.1